MMRPNYTLQLRCFASQLIVTDVGQTRGLNEYIG